MKLLAILLGIAAFAFLVNWVHAARLKRAERPEPPDEEPGPVEPVTPTAPEPALRVETTNPDETSPGYWFRKLFSPPLILGLMALAAQPVILWVNCYLLSMTLSIIYDTTPEAIAHVKFGSLERDLGLFDAVALMVSVGQMLLASAALHKRVSGSNGTGSLTGLAVTGWLTLATYEVGSSAYRSWVTGEGSHGAVLAGLIAFGVVILEAVCGSLAFEFLVAPLVLGLFWAVVAVFRTLCRPFAWAGRRVAAKFAAAPVATRRSVRPRASLLNAADDILQPLRDVDRIVYDGTIGRLASRIAARQVAPLVLLLLLLAPGASAQFSRPASTKPIDWMVAFDDTWSVPAQHLAAFKGEIFQKLVLVHLREKDTLYLFKLDRKRDREIQYLDLNGGRLHSAVVAFYRSKVEPIARARDLGVTDFGAALDFINRTVAARRDDPRQASQMALIFTDGEPSGPQTVASAPSAAVKLIFIGVQEKYERHLRASLHRAKVADSQFEVVRIDDGWQAWAAGFSRRINRTPNTTILPRLESAKR